MSDAGDLARILNNKKVHDNLRDGMPLPYTVVDAEEFISTTLAADQEKNYVFAIAVEDVAVGSIGVYRLENVHRLTAEIGYYIGEDHWGRGIGTSAIKQICQYIFENTDIVRIFAEPYAFNAPSCRILEKAGFTLEGVLRKNAIKNGVIQDMKMYAMVRETE